MNATRVRLLRAGLALGLGTALLTGCGGSSDGSGDGNGNGNDDKSAAKPSSSPKAKGSGSPSARPKAGASPDASAPGPGGSPAAYDFRPDPERVPESAGEARKFTRGTSLAPEDWSYGMARHRPYEAAPRTGTALSGSCVWQRGKLPPDTLDSYTRYIDLPGGSGKDTVRTALVVTVHKDEAAAVREIDETLQESVRCPEQELGGGQRLYGLVSMRFEKEKVTNAHASLMESGDYRGPDTGAKPQGYVWAKSRIGPVTAAVSVKGAPGHAKNELIQLAATGIAKVMFRIEQELN